MTAQRSVWLVLAMLAAAWSLALGVPFWLAAACLVCAVLPPLVGMIVRGYAAETQTAEIESALWLALATAAAASIGASTAVVLTFGVAIAIAWLSGSRRLTFETAGFALFGFAVSAIVSGSGPGWLHGHDATILSSGYGAAGLAQLALLLVLGAMRRSQANVAGAESVAALARQTESQARLDEAESRMRQAAAAAAEARIEAETAREKLEARTTFFAQTSHELRTPLNAIVGFAEMMEREVYGPLPERYLEYAGLIHQGGQNLTLIVDDVLDLARIDAGRFEIFREPVSLTDLADEAVRFMTGEAQRRGVELVLEGPDDAEAYADAKAVRQIALNLISNALKFTDKGGRVEVVAAEAPGGATLTVSDNGAGISAEDLARLSRAFEQGEAGKRHKGAGLGLSVVRAFADLHGGRLDIESRPGGGTRIAVFFPEEPQGHT